MLKKILLVVLALALGGAAFVVARIGPRNVIGMLRYDQRQEGKLRPGDRAPNVSLVALDGRTPMPLGSVLGEKPVVLVFGSFT
ncbi:MAG TPA: hypothetical protein VJA66_00425 [Thermoanaerobaculia bacterium]